MNASVKAVPEAARRTAPAHRPSAANRVYEDLRQRMLSLELPPGTSLLRAELALRYGVSQTPIREAMQRLAQDGLVRIYPQSGTVVTRIDIPGIHEAHFLRTALETEVSRQLARQEARDTVERARSVVRMQEASARDRAPAFQDLDEHFHRVLFEGAGRDGLHRLVRSRSGHLDRMRRLQWPCPEKVRRIIDGHAAILDAIALGDEEAAVAATRDHLSQTLSRLEEFRSHYGDFFS